jgi:hypothetical protein
VPEGRCKIAVPMPNLVQVIAQRPTVNAFKRVAGNGDDPRLWKYAPVFGDVVPEADKTGFYILGAFHIRSKTDVSRCYLDLSTPERINEHAYIPDDGELRYDRPRNLDGEFISAIAVDGFGNYGLFYSKIAPELGIDVLRRGLAASQRKHFIAEDLGYILRNEGRAREAAAAFQIAADEEVSSHYIYLELAELSRKLGRAAKYSKYAALFDKAEGRGGR